MNPITPDPTDHQKPRTRWVFPAVLTVAVAAAVAALAWTAGGGTGDTALATATGSTSAATSTATPLAPAAKDTTATGNPAKPAQPGAAAPDAVSTPPGAPLDATHAKASLHAFLGAVAAVDSTPELAQDLSTIASGAILEELSNDQLELDTNGWTQKGTPVVEAIKVLSSDPAAHVSKVQACIDSGAVEILDSEGKPVGHPDPATRRALNIYTLQQQADGSWHVTARTFPDNPNC